jgi:hypothetical protein
VRVRLREAGLWFAIATLLLVPGAKAQNPDTMDPDESAAKGKKIISQLIAGLGGPLYLNVSALECEGRIAQFGHNGDLTGFVNFKDYWGYPDKKRTDAGKKGNIIDLYVGDQGWTLDRGGVSEEPATAVSDFQAMLKRDVNNLLRHRIHEEGMAVRFGGIGVVDLHQVDWVEIQDQEERTFRLAVDQSSHLLVRSVVVTKDEDTGTRREDVTVYSNYQFKDGVQLPMQVTRERDGRRVYQVFYEGCQLNPPLPPDFFTRAALEKRYSEVGGKGKK